MRKSDFKFCFIVAGVMLVGLAFIDWRLSSGYAIGAVISMIMYKRNERYCDTILAAKGVSKWFQFGHFMNNYALMAIALLFGALIPQYFNIFGVALGLFLLKTAVIINTVINRKESKE